MANFKAIYDSNNLLISFIYTIRIRFFIVLKSICKNTEIPSGARILLNI